MTPASVNPTPFDRMRLSPLAQINLALLAALAAAFSVLLLPHWRHNPELSHGLFMPLIFLLLLHESRAAGPARFLPARGATTVALAGLLAAGLAALAIGGLFTAALDWSHALVGFTLAGALVLVLLAGLLAFASEPVRLVPFNWISFTAIFLWLLCAPIPPGTYTAPHARPAAVGHPFRAGHAAPVRDRRHPQRQSHRAGRHHGRD